MHKTETTLAITAPPALLAALHISASDPVHWKAAWRPLQRQEVSGGRQQI